MSGVFLVRVWKPWTMLFPLGWSAAGLVVCGLQMESVQGL